MRIYCKNAQGYYVYPIYGYLSFWLAVAVVGAFASSFLLGFIQLKVLFDFRLLAIVVSIILGLIEIVKVVYGSVKNKGLFKYINGLILADCVRRSLLNTMTLNLYKDNPSIEMPAVRVTFDDDKIRIYISKLPGMDDIEKLQSNINSSFRGRFKPYAVTTAIQDDDGTGFNFVLENVGENKTFTPRVVEDLIQKPYIVKLQEDLTLNLSKYPHIAVWGQSGFGKTTVLMNIIAQCLSNETDLSGSY